MSDYSMKVLFIASECAPLAKVGGLADVVGSLPKALHELGADVRIALPKYDVIDDKKFPSKEIVSLSVPFGGEIETVSVRQTELPESEIVVYLLDHTKYFGNGGIYIETDASSGGSRAELNRFGLFSRSIPELIRTLKWMPDVIHCHDWQTGTVPTLFRHPVGAGFTSAPQQGQAQGLPLQHVKTLFTIHNLAYQGIHPRTDVERAFGASMVQQLQPHPTNSNEINFLASAITAADRVSTVSPTYAREITMQENGQGLNAMLKNLPHPPIGILNGIDTDYWNPETDKFLHPYVRRGVLQYAPTIKPRIKQNLQEELKFSADTIIPLLVMVSRLTEQKGFDILIPALRALLLAQEFQCVILATGDKRYATALNELAQQFPKKLHFAEAFNEPLAHRLYAAGDFFLMPSRFEPCGLGQMIAMRYGTIPLATQVGGLKDTVKNGETGFVVPTYTTNTLTETIRYALTEYREHPDRLNQLRENGMHQDFSWTHSAEEYVKLYQEIIHNNQVTRNKDTNKIQ